MTPASNKILLRAALPTRTRLPVPSGGFMYGKSLHFSAKAAAYQALDRLKKVPEKSIAIRVPSKPLMLELSDYLSSSSDDLSELHHNIAMGAEPPALAAGAIATLLEGGTAGVIASRMLGALHTQIRCRRGGNTTLAVSCDSTLSLLTPLTDNLN